MAESPLALAARRIEAETPSSPRAAAPAEVASTNPWRRIIVRPSRIAVLCLVVVFAVASAALVTLSWRSAARLDEISRLAKNRTRIDSTSLRSILAEFALQAPPDPAVLDALRGEIDRVRAEGIHLDPATSARLERLRGFLAEPEPLPPARQLAALDLVREILDAEGNAESQLLGRIAHRARQEFELSLVVVGALLLMGLSGWWTLRRRIMHPLGDLGGLLTRLAEGEFEAVHVEGVQPFLLPLFRNYNFLVMRLAALEREHKTRARTLEAEVHTATHALLAQQHTLARAERLAAVGEMAGSLAHELRNPLAGIQMSLTNLRRDVGSTDLIQRIDLAAAEVDRLARMLNVYLSAARHSPEPLQRVDLHALVLELVALLRYQVPEHVQLDCCVPADLAAQLPRDRIRQALLNLVLNSVQAFRDAPGAVAIAGRRDRDHVVLSVCDTGPGLPPELLAYGVQPFATQREAGTGLGLAMVRRVVLELGGELRFENREPGGACVHLSLPCGLA